MRKDIPMKIKTIALVVSAASTLFAVADPSVSGVSLAQAPDSFLVTVDYTLSGGPAVVTFDIQTNRTGSATADEADWSSIGEQTLTNAFGDVNCLVENGARTIFWRADDTWKGKFATSGAARAVVTAWSTNSPPDYLVVDLRRDSDRVYCPEPRVRYFTSTNALPGGILSDAYCNEYIALRRIPSQGVKWCMGSPADEIGHVEKETQHYVTFTNADFYMAVFPMTRGQILNFGVLQHGDQWGLIDVLIATNPNVFLYQYIRCFGTTNEAPLCVSDMKSARGIPAYGADWLVNGHAVTNISVCGLMRERTGVEFDLPTEAQWEFAYRAGTSSAYHDGTSPRANMDYAGLPNIGWIDSNSRIDGTYYLRRVGMKKPNAWGLYDMSGSVFEWCLDRYSATMSADSVMEPKGPETGSTYVLRGGCYSYSYSYARAAAKTEGSGVPTQSAGVRPICPVCLKWPK